MLQRLADEGLAELKNLVSAVQVSYYNQSEGHEDMSTATGIEEMHERFPKGLIFGKKPTPWR